MGFKRSQLFVGGGLELSWSVAERYKAKSQLAQKSKQLMVQFRALICELCNEQRCCLCVRPKTNSWYELARANRSKSPEAAQSPSSYLTLPVGWNLLSPSHDLPRRTLALTPRPAHLPGAHTSSTCRLAGGGGGERIFAGTRSRWPQRCRRSRRPARAAPPSPGWGPPPASANPPPPGTTHATVIKI